jgi:hypothetical protein
VLGNLAARRRAHVTSKVLCIARRTAVWLMIAALLVGMLIPSLVARGTSAAFDFAAGKTAVASNGATVLKMTVPPVYDATTERLFLPVTAVASVFAWKCVVDAKNGAITLTTASHTIILKVGSKTITVDRVAKSLSDTVRNVLGSAMAPVDLVNQMGGATSMSTDGRTCRVTPGTLTPLPLPLPTPSPLSNGTDPASITRMTKTVIYASKSYKFEIIRIDLKGKGVSIVPVAAPGGMNTGSAYTTFAHLSSPLALINGLPFDTSTHETTGSLGGGGLCPQVKSGYTETIGIDANGVPFYDEGRLEVRADVMSGEQAASMTTYSINSKSWGGFTVYTNWYPKAVWVGSDEALCVVDHGSVVQHVRGATFQPCLMQPGQLAIHGYQAAVNHWTLDTITPLVDATSVRLHIYLGTRDLADGFFIQSAPVVLRAGQPIMGAARYPDSFRMTKSGARSFLGIGGGRYLYFISTPTAICLRTDNVGGALASLKMFTDVISLDGGGSTTLYYKGSYIYTPGRQLVTCIAVPQ